MVGQRGHLAACLGRSGDEEIGMLGVLFQEARRWPYLGQTERGVVCVWSVASAQPRLELPDHTK